jgi:uncharacterized Ntn-hydrolase superfamily protein
VRIGRLTSTYSIVARCRTTRELGIGVQSHYFAVGASVPWVATGIGAIATQAVIAPEHGPAALAELTAGRSPATVVDALLGDDSLRELRQIAVMDPSGAIAVHTGNACIPACGHRFGQDYAVLGNMLSSHAVLAAMANSFERSGGPLAERLRQALEAGESEGGDVRGMMSAAIRVVPGDRRQPAVDVRVDHHAQPLEELRRLLTLALAQAHLTRALSLGPCAEALLELDEATRIAPGEDEFRFWRAVVLIGLGDPARASQILSGELSQPARWRGLLSGLEAVGLVHLEDPALRRFAASDARRARGDEIAVSER